MSQPVSNPHCVYCQRTSDQVPLIPIMFKGEELHICSQHMPVLIHHPEQLAEFMPGTENLEGHQH
ncbi:MAG: hypothetical protein D6675_01515 [Gemmatimonadetes bacterium]|nr:MAG: hypothetical protein D6675_01515 [Gemmatimonadota bacterium]